MKGNGQLFYSLVSRIFAFFEPLATTLKNLSVWEAYGPEKRQAARFLTDFAGLRHGQLLHSEDDRRLPQQLPDEVRGGHADVPGTSGSQGTRSGARIIFIMTKTFTHGT